LMATGRLLSMAEARDAGLVHEVWGDEDLKGRSFADAILDYARQFTPPNKASRAVGRMKRAVQSGAEAGFLEGLAIERELQQLLFQSDDAKEGLAASLEKRKPKFAGR
jgi:enoyl-CoA hydratase